MAKLCTATESADQERRDDAILDTYLEHRNLAGRFRAEAEATWATYKRLPTASLFETQPVTMAGCW